MKKWTAILLLILNGCASTPSHEAWKASLATPNPPGVDGNCLPVAQKLQVLYGGQIAVLSKGDSRHAVLMIDDEHYLDNGTLGYSGPWSKAIAKGWRFRYWWRP